MCLFVNGVNLKKERLPSSRIFFESYSAFVVRIWVEVRLLCLIVCFQYYRRKFLTTYHTCSVELLGEAVNFGVNVHSSNCCCGGFK